MNKMRKTLAELIREMEKAKQEEIQEGIWSTHFHIMPPVGWLNDPNGLCYYQGKYHFFFQYAPFDENGGLNLWGKYESKDMLHWEYVGAMLFPDSPYDCHGVYSGCAFTADGDMEIFYTGNVKLDGDYDYVLSGREANVIYVSSKDGRQFTDKECLLTKEDYPDSYTRHIRDPKVWKEMDRYYMVMGGRKKSDLGAVLFFESKDKKNWKYTGELTTKEPFGYMWECPDVFMLGGRRILSVSPQGLKRDKFMYQNVYQSGWFEMLESDAGVALSEFTEWDMGFDFYAPQTFRDEKGRRILVGWAGLPDIDKEYTNPTTALGWQHLLTLPRQLYWKDEKICQKPIEEVRALRGERMPLEPDREICIGQSCFELEITEAIPGNFQIIIEKECEIVYTDGMMEIRFNGKIGAGRTVRRAKVKELEQIQILADTSILEVFVNGGETVFTTRYFPENSSRTIECKAVKGNCSLWLLN